MIGLDSIRSIHYCQLQAFTTNRGTCFSLEAIPNGMKTFYSCTVRAQSPMKVKTETIGVCGARRD